MTKKIPYTQGTLTTITDVLAKKHGLTKTMMRSLVCSFVDEIGNQLLQHGKVMLSGLGTFRLEYSIRSGKVEPFYYFRWHAALTKRLKQTTTNSFYAPLAENILKRDEKKYRGMELRRLDRLKFMDAVVARKKAEERVEKAALLTQMTGKEVLPENVPQELLIPSRAYTPRLPGHLVDIRDWLTKSGVLALSTPCVPEDQRVCTPQDQPVADNAPV
jgi:hypothetical protein